MPKVTKIFVAPYNFGYEESVLDIQFDKVN